jgi:ABC-type transporter Mla maintaining outer membrane lipid asymmetry ATPase subunit MlaF
MTSVVQAMELSKRFRGANVLEGLDLDVPKGSEIHSGWKCC